jgi:hypothetical protein
MNPGLDKACALVLFVGLQYLRVYSKPIEPGLE